MRIMVWLDTPHTPIMEAHCVCDYPSNRCHCFDDAVADGMVITVHKPTADHTCSGDPFCDVCLQDMPF